MSKSPRTAQELAKHLGMPVETIDELIAEHAARRGMLETFGTHLLPVTRVTSEAAMWIQQYAVHDAIGEAIERRDRGEITSEELELERARLVAIPRL